MASDRQQFKEAASHWQKLMDNKAFSAPARTGGVAIICSGWSYEESGTPEAHEELDGLQTEAHAIADGVTSAGKKAEVALNATPSDVTRLLQDPQFATVYTIGNGNLSSINLKSRGDYDWLNLAKDMTHLKLGNFVQRHCGLLSRTTNVPLGLFAVKNARNVFAPVGETFNPDGLYCEEKQKIKRVFRRRNIRFEDVKRLSPKDTEIS